MVIDTDKLMECIMTIGERMIISGAEVYRVEDSLTRILSAYCFTNINVFAVMPVIVICAEKTGKIYNLARRVGEQQNDMEKLRQLNSLSRYICENTPDIEYIEKKTEEIDNIRIYNIYIKNLFYFLSAASFSCISGGTPIDMTVSGILGIFLIFTLNYLRNLKINRIFTLIISTALTGVIAVLIRRCGADINTEVVIMGDIILIIPGLMLAGAVRDLFNGDTIAGLLRLSEAALSGFAIAVGFALALAFSY